jgi:hypothetical protein
MELIGILYNYMYGAPTREEFAVPSSRTPAALSWLPAAKKETKAIVAMDIKCHTLYHYFYLTLIFHA